MDYFAHGLYLLVPFSKNFEMIRQILNRYYSLMFLFLWCLCLIYTFLCFYGFRTSDICRFPSYVISALWLLLLRSFTFLFNDTYGHLRSSTILQDSSTVSVISLLNDCFDLCCYFLYPFSHTTIGLLFFFPYEELYNWIVRLRGDVSCSLENAKSSNWSHKWNNSIWHFKLIFEMIYWCFLTLIEFV